MEIIVIGPNPPCIRCSTTAKRAKRVAERILGNQMHFRYILLPDPAAEQYGKVACGREIEEIGNVRPDFDHMHRLLHQLDLLESDQESNAAEIDRLLRELDEVLTPVRAKAEELGYLMTPVLLINGLAKSAGYVPSEADIERWVSHEIAS